jgi:hypothetical protein
MRLAGCPIVKWADKEKRGGRTEEIERLPVVADEVIDERALIEIVLVISARPRGAGGKCS